MASQRLSIGWFLKIIVWCLIVGVALSALGVTAGDFWNSMWRAAQSVYDWGVQSFGWTWDYILIGAAVVIPIVLVRLLLNALRGR